MLVQLLALIGIIKVIQGGNCGGNCPSGGCNTCPCGTTRNQLSASQISEWCGKYKGWDQSTCECIVKAESAGNANAMNENTKQSQNYRMDVGLWQINTFNWEQCNGGNAPCGLAENLACARKVFEWGGKTFKNWATCGKCNACNGGAATGSTATNTNQHSQNQQKQISQKPVGIAQKQSAPEQKQTESTKGTLKGALGKHIGKIGKKIGKKWKERRFLRKSDSKQSAHVGITDGYEIDGQDVVYGYEPYVVSEVSDGREMMTEIIVSMFGVTFFCCVCGVTSVICGVFGFMVGKRVKIAKEEYEDDDQQ